MINATTVMFSVWLVEKDSRTDKDSRALYEHLSKDLHPVTQTQAVKPVLVTEASQLFQGLFCQFANVR